MRLAKKFWKIMIGLIKMQIFANIADLWPVFDLFLTYYNPDIIVQSSQWVNLSLFWLDWVRLAKEFYITLIFLEKLLFLAILTHFWPVFEYLWTLYSLQILVDKVFTTVLARYNWKIQPRDNSGLQVAKKTNFYPKIGIKMDFWKGGPKNIQKWRSDSCSAWKNVSK